MLHLCLVKRPLHAKAELQLPKKGIKMKKNSYQLIIVVMILLFSVKSYSQVSFEELKSNIDINKLQHPYLFFNNQEKEQMRNRIEKDSSSRNIMKELVVVGNRFLRMPFEKKTLLEPKHPRFESENEASSYLSQICKGALTLSFLYQITGEDKYVKRAYEFAEAISDVPEWRYTAHSYDIIYSRVWPWNVPDDQVVFSFDLGTARVSRILSTVYDWLYPILSREQKDKIRNAILEEAVTRVRGNYDLHWWASAHKCNWSSVCFGGLGVSAIVLLKENPQLFDVVAESFNRINKTFDQIGDEGGWQEGRGYFSYMLEGGLFFGEALKRISNEKYNLFSHPKIQANAISFLLYALTASFGDSNGNPGGSSFLINKYINETNNVTSAFYRDKFVNDGNELFDLIWTRSKVKGVEPKEKSRFFKNINWAILRSDFFDPASVTVACKAGYNNDPHHGHLDCGQFILTWHNIPFIKDLGRMSYDEHYFDNERFDYPYASSDGHNVIMVNDEKQITAKTKNEPWKENIGGKIIDFRTSDKRDYVLMDPTGAYPGKELKKWRRNIILEKPDVTLLLDEVHSEVGSNITARFFPGVGELNNPEERNPRRRNQLAALNSNSSGYKIHSNHVMLSDGKGHNMALIPIALNNAIMIREDKLASMLVTAEEKVEWLPYVETIISAKEKNNFLATLLLPVKDKNDADMISSSAKMILNGDDEIEISFNYSGKELHWNFIREKEGFILK